MKLLILPVLLLLSASVLSQKEEQSFIRLAMPARDNNAVRSPKQFLSGATCKSCVLTINDQPVKVYPTGAFAYEMNMQPGVNTFNLVSTSPGKSKVSKKLTYSYSVPVADTVKTLGIRSITILPEGNLIVAPGDKIKFKVKALSGCTVTANGTIPLFELPASNDNLVPGIYQGEYTVTETDSFFSYKDTDTDYRPRWEQDHPAG